MTVAYRANRVSVTVPVPNIDELDLTEEPVDPRPYSDLVAALMEIRSCSRPDAETWVDRVGDEKAERVIRARWLKSDFKY
ncbi:hypothetical protein C499_06670 [Halogeometricum borinquense DSM 11551]|uniref:Uncharacterized protein n=1 Tax=Halogeometricum borinquense (strain ATCC 700274 / DSM 11551 / JCM 10706 / KCTC 4070 / PR3) TaxID=469382 RepID=L9UW87_HALBP|nr:hypothetical protein C499_06670 [Halogeometricum borinquense DSM 11551]